MEIKNNVQNIPIRWRLATKGPSGAFSNTKNRARCDAAVCERWIAVVMLGAVTLALIDFDAFSRVSFAKFFAGLGGGRLSILASTS